MALNDKIIELKQQLHSVSQQNFKLEIKVNSLRTREHILTEEMENVKVVYGFCHSQITELSGEISEMEYQKAIINVCAKSEEAKIEVHLSNLDKHKNGYDILFNKERAMSAIQREHLIQKEEEEKEMVRQKMAKTLEQNEQQMKAAAAIEDECVAIERECSSLLNRNKAIMKRLRRRLIETEDMRRELTQNKFCDN